MGGSGRVLGPSRGDLGPSRRHQDGPRMDQKCSFLRPSSRRASELSFGVVFGASKRRQETPRRCPRGPKRCPGASKRRPGGLRERSDDALGSILERSEAGNVETSIFADSTAFFTHLLLPRRPEIDLKTIPSQPKSPQHRPKSTQDRSRGSFERLDGLPEAILARSSRIGVPPEAILARSRRIRARACAKVG